MGRVSADANSMKKGDRLADNGYLTFEVVEAGLRVDMAFHQSGRNACRRPTSRNDRELYARRNPLLVEVVPGTRTCAIQTFARANGASISLTGAAVTADLGTGSALGLNNREAKDCGGCASVRTALQ
jgi:hypothetical protein